MASLVHGILGWTAGNGKLTQDSAAAFTNHKMDWDWSIPECADRWRLRVVW